jgi:hypothetical protein
VPCIHNKELKVSDYKSAFNVATLNFLSNLYILCDIEDFHGGKADDVLLRVGAM